MSEPHFAMVNIQEKAPTHRQALACGTIYLGKRAFAHVRDRTLPKGDALLLAETAGLLAAKQTAHWIPLCHPLPLDAIQIRHELNPTTFSVTLYAEVAAHTKTGVEMEALTAVQAGLLTIWDLAKQIEPDLTIGDVRLLIKEGGKSGRWVGSGRANHTA
ncbi:hypothetical protein CKO15_00535 [Halorhodospira abdelmalekii]|uniref:cyclic pyranopterin monophosphate synthase n=1 Tax=Halorhodospira abdelmalekii TaxID=421629 RepID=UPI001907BAF3|nr:cyclic pyranopterin monophosphate synthase MoaC [Halorhodospira abdelmalekii]MBK1733792.1 hypothetical protein [Halorhodospira abdelmalekii]